MSSFDNNNVSNNSNTKDVTSVFIFDAKPGMILSSDVSTPDGTRIATANTTLDMNLILKISNHHILEVNIFKPVKTVRSTIVTAAKDTKKEASPATKSKATNYYEKVRETDAFVEFEAEYQKDVSALKNNLNDAVFHNTPIDIDSLLSASKSILKEQKNNLAILDMLHCMRDQQDQTYAHCVNVSLIATVIGKWLHFPQKQVDILTLSGLLHDIGKLMIPQEILLKPGRLSPDEYRLIKQHVTLGYDKLKSQSIDNQIKEACLFHHEKSDGSGYPLGLKNEEIPVTAKIVAIADVYDAMTASRSYRQPICPFEVVKTLNNESFTKFDPKYMIPFLKNVASSYLHNNVLLSNQQIGEVIIIQDHALSQPVVQCGDEFIDLYKHPELSIVKVLQ